MAKFILHIFCLIVYPFSFILPRSRSKWAFGSYRGMFNDNSKYLFIYMSENHPEIDSVWLSTKKSTVNKVKSLGLKAYWLASPKGIWFALRSRYWIVNSYTADIMFCLSGKTKVINLWHGIGLKKCEFNITNGPLADRYVRKTLKEHITHPEAYRRPDLLLTVSDFQSEMFAKAFRLPYSKCLLKGYPRNEIMIVGEKERSRFIEKYENESLKALIAKAKSYNEVFVYMPTWRDSQREIFTQGFDLERLNDLMRARNGLMLLKPHANTIVDRESIKGYSNILLVDNSVDMYPLLAYCDVLITDYSSILYDFILKPECAVILYLYDIADYQGIRDFYFPFDENVTGVRALDFEKLIEIIKQGKYYGSDYADKNELRKKFWGDSVAITASEDIFKYIIKI